jgi:hypothetical protein
VSEYGIWTAAERSRGGTDIRSLRMGLIGVCLGRGGLGVWGGMEGFSWGIGRGSGGRCDPRKEIDGGGRRGRGIWVSRSVALLRESGWTLYSSLGFY